MSRAFGRSLCAMLAGAMLSSCGGGNGAGGAVAGALPNASSVSSAGALSPDRHRRRHPEKAYMRIVIPRLHRHKHEHFVSAATLSAKFVATDLTTNVTITTVADLSPSSGNCVNGSGTRTCTVSTLVPIGNDRINLTTFDKAPVNGVIPASADELGIGSVTQQVVSGVTPQIAIFLGGVIAGINASPAFASLPADGSNHNAAFAVDPVDFGNQPIKAGKNDPYSNPITVTLTEAGGAGHANLVLNGKGSGSSATLTESTDTIALKYDGGGPQGYFVHVNFSATGAPTEKTQVAPMYVSSASSLYSPFKLTLQGTTVTAAVDVNEAGSPPASQSYAATRSGCGTIATVATASNTPASAAFNVTGGATASTVGTCTITIGDGSSSIVLDVSNTKGSGGVGLPGTTINTFAIASPTQVVVGPNGDLWLTQSLPSVQEVTTGGTFTAYNNFTYQVTNIVSGPDGAMWATDTTTPAIVRLVPTGSGPTTYYTHSNGAIIPGTMPNGIAAGPDGYIWFTDSSNDGIDRMSITGNTTFTASPNDNVPGSIAAGPDNAMWFTEASTNAIGRIDLSSLVVVETNLTAPLLGAPQSMVKGPDGAMWFVVPSVDGIGRMATDGSFTITSFAPGAGTAPTAIAAGPDNAMYFIESGTNLIGRLDLKTHLFTTFPQNGAGGATTIVTGPDGNIWYGETAAGQLIQMTP